MRHRLALIVPLLLAVAIAAAAAVSFFGKAAGRVDRPDPYAGYCYPHVGPFTEYQLGLPANCEKAN